MTAHKTLSPADLRLAPASRQTHIGLLEEMVKNFGIEPRKIDVFFYTPALGVEIPCKGLLNAIKRESGAVNAPKLTSANGSFTIDEGLNVLYLIQHFANTGSKPRELWMWERDDGIFKIQLLPSEATEIYAQRVADEPWVPYGQVSDGALNKLPTSICRVKPFLILAGPSGTGKSRWVRQQAFHTHKASTEERSSNATPPNYQLVSVKPNWNDSSELLGYVTRMGLQPGQSARYVVTDFIRFLIRAWRQLDTPHWLCLDEMNLAPVEQYLAEFLSVIETRRVQDGKVTTDALMSPESLAALSNTDWELFCRDAGIQETDEIFANEIRRFGLRLPPNLVVVGTVNMDETTHSFSRKVLDRAFVWEMSIGDLASSWERLVYPMTPAPWLPLVATTGAEARALLDGRPDNLAEALLEWLKKVNVALADSPFEISYRVRDELLLLAVARDIKNVDEMHRVIDDGLYAKVLPRIEGDAERVRRPLVKLGRLLADASGLEDWSGVFTEYGEEDRHKLTDLKIDQYFLFGSEIPPDSGDPFAPMLPWRRSLRKIRSMLLRLNGHFTSYWD
jgi:hypothetical protein